jgi:Predicted nucleic acid-binding protein, contains PIN domain
MIVLDTNVISELMRPRGYPPVIAWADDQPTSEIYLTAVTTAELRYGVARLPDGRRKTDLANRIERSLAEDFAGRILPFDDNAAALYAEIVTHREQRGLPISMADAQIAAICRHLGGSLATRNTKDFAHTGVDVVDPWSTKQ